ncbi:DUF2231 domain-containing protein [Endobacterium cereale]|uniref:DUF2231 domain-containing protein n=1 Tax=Endobacterium cereale TaxID=2663029 RepID=UPI002B495DAD|nr:DUF2231 domain-containing protein [Endobacterium cereale]MEB2846704.1 DUF2231 domain-containing protein [Endobacterium cereale]
MEDKTETANPVIAEVAEKDASSMIAVAGHPLHAMSVHFPIALAFLTLAVDMLFWWSADAFWTRVGVWSSGGAFFFGVAAGLVGTIELLSVPGIRERVASWAHAISAVTLIACAGLNWGLRVTGAGEVLPHGILVSLLTCIMTGMAGWHGGKLIFDHGVGLMVSAKD